MGDLADEFARRCRTGSCPSVTQYAESHPELADEIRDVFPAIAAMELASRREQLDRADTRRLHEIDQRLLDRLGDYRIIRQIGRGGMGVVYEAIQVSLGRTVALKVLTANVAHAPKQLARFQRKAQAAAMLHHTNIVPIFGVGFDDGLHYYVMQYIDGISLDRLIHGYPTSRDVIASHDGEACDEMDPRGKAAALRTTSSRRWRLITSYGMQIAQAVDYAHKQGVLHRDIKPANLLVDVHETVWVTDFGLAKVFGDSELTQSGDVFGTIRYMAPEQFAGESTTLSDVYSIGVTLYELATRQVAFANSDAQQLIHTITHQGLPRPRMAAPGIPRDLETIIMKAAAFDPRHRYPTAAELAEDLRRFHEGEPITARRTGVPRRIWRWSCRNPALAALSGLSFLLLLLVAVVATIGLIHVEAARRNAIELASRAQRRSDQLRLATQRAQTESNRARSESQRAEDNLQLAMRAFEDVMQRVSGRGLPESMEMDLEDETRELPPRLFTDEDAELLQSLLVFYEEFARQNHGDESVRLETAKAHHRIGDIRQSLGQLDQALEAYDQALDIYRRVPNRDRSHLDTILATVTVLNQRGLTYARAGDVRSSIASHLAARDLLLGQPPEIAGTNAARLALVETYNNLGAIWYRADVTGIPVFGHGPPGRRAALTGQHRLSTLDWMEENHQSALDLLETMMADDPTNVDYRLALARCYRNGLPLVWHGGSADAAAERLSAAVSILEQLTVDFPDTPRYSFELADILSIDTPELVNTQFGKASWQRLEQAEQIARKLNSTYPNQPEYKTLYANALYRLGLILDRNDQLDLAVRHLAESVRHYQELLERFPHIPAYVVSLGRVSVDLSILQRQARRWDDAHTTLDNAILRLIATYDPNSDTRAARRLLAVLQMHLKATQRHGELGP